MIDKRGYSRLARQFEESHPTISAIAPLVCFLIAFAVAILLLLVSIFGGAANTLCVGTNEFWYSSTGGNWPLVSSFLLTVFLLFVWSIFMAFDEWNRSTGTRVVIVANAIGIAAMICAFVSVHQSATIAYDVRAGLYDNITYRNRFVFSRLTESVCVTMRRFVGRWRVVDRKVGIYGFDIPAQWIELKPWGVLYAQDATWSRPYAEWWRPPVGPTPFVANQWHEGTLFDAPWDFELQGDTLILTTPEEWFQYEWQRSQVTLRREPIPDLPVYPNPFAVP